MISLLAATAAAPSGLQISMLFLFQIIAGLLLADLFKQAVEVLNKSAALANVLLILAAAAFLVRLLVDNFIFYAGSDLPPGSASEYAIRIVLLLIDLTAFAVGYDLVYQVSASGLRGTRHVLSFARARRVLWSMAAIEMLHTGWGLIDSWMSVRGGASVRTVLIGATHGTVTGRWLLLSFIFALLPLPLIKTIRRTEDPADVRTATTVALFSFVSALTYAIVMKDYYIGQLKP